MSLTNHAVVVVRSGNVRCPQCSSVFNIKQHTSNGAAYARKMKRLPPSGLKILTWWLASSYIHQSLTKQFLRGKLRGKTSVGSPFDARISELKNWNVLNTSYHKRVKSGKVSLVPTYQLNITKAKKILEAGGRK